MRLAQFLKLAHAKLSDFMSTKALTTHDGMLKAMALKAERAARPVAPKPRGKLVGYIEARRGSPIPFFYKVPPPTRLNRSRKWKPAATYTEAAGRA